MLGAIGSGDWLILDLSGSVSAVGPGIERLGPVREWVGRSFVEAVHPDDRPELRQAFARVAAELSETEHCAIRVIDSFGLWRRYNAVFSNGLDEPIVAGVVVALGDQPSVELDGTGAIGEAHFRIGFERAAIGMVVLDAGHRLLKVNRAFAELVGRPARELLGHQFEEVVHADDRSAHANELELVISGGRDTYRTERRLLRPDGSSRFVMIDATRVDDSNRPGTTLICQLVDQTAQRESEALLAHQALHDRLTELPNRNLLTDRIERALERQSHAGGLVAVSFVDVDRFNLVVETIGHAAGDRLLLQVARRLSATAGRADTVARFGGDQFVAVREIRAEAELAGFGEELLEQFQRPFLLGERELRVSASCGLVAAGPGATAEELLSDAESAMTRAKWHGGGHIEIFEPSLRRATTRRFGLEQALCFALDREELRVVYQPIVRIADGNLVGAEALLRWDQTEWGSIRPSEFIEVAEATGMIVPMGAFALSEALRQVMSWRRDLEGSEELWVATNLSSRQLYLDDPVRRCAEALSGADAPPDALRIELTESSVMEEVDVSVGRLERLANLGVALAIDDFGTGHSSLSYLARLPVRTLKIDRSFTAGLVAGAPPSPVLQAIANLAGAMALELCAEGIEAPNQLAALGALGCDLAQGYLIAPPLEPEQFVGFAARARGPAAP